MSHFYLFCFEKLIFNHINIKPLASQVRFYVKTPPLATNQKYGLRLVWRLLSNKTSLALFCKAHVFLPHVRHFLVQRTSLFAKLKRRNKSPTKTVDQNFFSNWFFFTSWNPTFLKVHQTLILLNNFLGQQKVRFKRRRWRQQRRRQQWRRRRRRRLSTTRRKRAIHSFNWNRHLLFLSGSIPFVSSIGKESLDLTMKTVAIMAARNRQKIGWNLILNISRSSPEIANYLSSYSTKKAIRGTERKFWFSTI